MPYTHLQSRPESISTGGSMPTQSAPPPAWPVVCLLTGERGHHPFSILPLAMAPHQAKHAPGALRTFVDFRQYLPSQRPVGSWPSLRIQGSLHSHLKPRDEGRDCGNQPPVAGREAGRSAGEKGCGCTSRSGQCPAGAMVLTSLPPALSGIEVTAQYKTEKDQFSWIKVTFKNPELQVHAFSEHVVVTRNRRNSAYKWKETLFSVIPGYVWAGSLSGHMS